MITSYPMFYAEEDISKVLFCPKCGKKFTDPRTLPCGGSLCYECIVGLVPTNSATRSTTASIRCPICNNNHDELQVGRTTESLPKNDFIAKLSDMRPLDVMRGDLCEKLKQKVRVLMVKSSELKDSREGSSQIIADNCEEIRRQIDMATEAKIETLQNYRKQFLENLKKYESDCLKSVESQDNENEEFLKKIDKFYQEIRTYLKVYLSLYIYLN